MRFAWLALVGLIGCEGEAKSSLEGTPLPASLRCEGTLAPIEKPVVDDKAGPPPVAGQMSDAAGKAKRLFDAEKWTEALPALLNVANGETGDDVGNKQLAEYKVAITLFRLRRNADSYAAFKTIARAPSHLKHNESLLWFYKIAQTNPELIDLGDIALYSADSVQRFDNPNQREAFQTLSYLLARARIAQSPPDTAEAKRLFAKVPADHPWAAEAKTCLAKLP